MNASLNGWRLPPVAWPLGSWRDMRPSQNGTSTGRPMTQHRENSTNPTKPTKNPPLSLTSFRQGLCVSFFCSFFCLVRGIRGTGCFSPVSGYLSWIDWCVTLDGRDILGVSLFAPSDVPWLSRSAAYDCGWMWMCSFDTAPLSDGLQQDGMGPHYWCICHRRKHVCDGTIIVSLLFSGNTGRST